MLFNSTGGATWDDNGPDGDGQAVELIGSTRLRRLPRRLERRHHGPAQGLSASNGQPTTFSPATDGVLGVFDLAQAPSGRFVAVGDFKDMGSTHNLNGVAIFS